MKVKRTPGRGTEELQRAIKELGKSNAKVGWFESAKYPDGTSVAYIAAIQEFGNLAKKIPPRLSMRMTIKEKTPEWKAKMELLAKRVLKGQATGKEIMEIMGQKAAGDFRKKITTVTEPPLKQATIDARRRQRADKKTVGSLTKPLVDTKVLLNTLTNIVADK